LAAYETLRDERGEPYQRFLAHASWTRASGWSTQDFALPFDAPPQGDTIILETDNGDNPPIELGSFQLFYPATRVLCKANPDDKLFLYYGNPNVNSPQYDLSLVSNEILAASKANASLGAEEQLRKPWPPRIQANAKDAVVFWAALGLVVVVLLLIIAKLLPKR
jgi:hypothetical protein